MVFACRGLVAFFIVAVSSAIGAAREPAEAVCYRDVIYLSVDKLAEYLQGTVGLSAQARGLTLKTKDKHWEFVDGGQRLKVPAGKELTLERPLLVLEGKQYFPLEECGEAFGYRVAPHQKDPQGRLVSFGTKEQAIEPVPVGSIYQRHKVDKLEVVHEFVVVEKPLRGRRTTHRPEDVRELLVGSTLIVRRKVEFDGTPHVIASDCGPSLDSFLIAAKDLEQNTKPGSGAKTTWSQHRSWFMDAAQQEAALRRGEPQQLGKTVAVTVDLCWSLRRCETGLFQTLKQVAGQSKKKICPVMFVSGRWLQQHPMEMHDLVQLSLEPNVEIIWGHHSWDHPKAGGFMNDYPPAQLREDTLRLEREYLEWGIAPTVYYRFPGLIHDRVRLREILGLDLFPIDCDSWLALVKQQDKGPFYYNVRDGGIILVHGNGNEPGGIPPLDRWFQEHRDWEVGHLNRFFPPAD
jgi:hypothetical protein